MKGALKSHWRVSIPRPADYKSAALPTELQWRKRANYSQQINLSIKLVELSASPMQSPMITLCNFIRQILNALVYASFTMETAYGNLPNSALTVIEALSRLKIAKFEDLKSETSLPKRTLLYAIRILRDAGLVHTQICMNDARRRFYCISISHDEPTNHLKNI